MEGCIRKMWSALYVYVACDWSLQDIVYNVWGNFEDFEDFLLVNKRKYQMQYYRYIHNNYMMLGYVFYGFVKTLILYPLLNQSRTLRD